MNAGEAQAMVGAADRSGKFLIEAYHYRFHPLFARVLEVIESDRIGALRELRAHFNVRIAPERGEIRYDPALGGGAMMDLGCYCVHGPVSTSKWKRGSNSRAASGHGYPRQCRTSYPRGWTPVSWLQASVAR
jgi:hypothetical protein